MKDIHSHILYGIDDGSNSLKESIEILKKASNNGVTDIVLTPHYIKESIYTADNKTKNKLLKELKKELKNNNININLYLGNEVYIDKNITKHLKNDISTINNSKYILIELPLNNKSLILDEVLYELKKANLIPIIAHPERYINYYKDYDFFDNLLKKGCLFQANIGSLYGIYGKKAKKMLKGLLKRKMIHFFGSDIHHQRSEIYKKNIKKDLLKIVKDKRLVEDLLINNTEKVLNNKKIGRSKIMNESNILNQNIETNQLTRTISKNLYFITKRLFDIIASLLGLIVISPIFILIGILIRLEDGGAPLFKQERIGKNGKTFKLYKFRSMVKNADEILYKMLEEDTEQTREYKINKKMINDPRITKIGKILRKTSLDEVPQLINVFKGEMSLIGNRPYLPREKEDMGKYYDDIIKSKPGITGYWQISGRSNITFKERLKLESFYSNNINLKMDIKIFFKTFYVVLFRKGAE
jgi:lipopolysaccharide/colanic/teichoic acid biosynthesis glycosyltransferase/tyrosine-protein phosphatase YwqE